MTRITKVTVVMITKIRKTVTITEKEKKGLSSDYQDKTIIGNTNFKRHLQKKERKY